MLPLLKYFGDEKEHQLRETIDTMAKQFGLTAEERREFLPSGRKSIFDNRVGWAKTYIKKAGLIEITRRSYFKITKRGLEVLQENPKEINVRYLKQFPEFLEFLAPKREKEELKEEEEEEEEEGIETKELLTPEERIESAYQRLRQNLATELIQQIKNCSPSFFEKLVIDLLISMGYGGTRKDAGEAIGRSGDEGIDGIIKEDRLGLDIVYIQAKRWENPVSRPEIQKFAGALMGRKAKKGIFITTSAFTKDAREYA